MTQQPCDAAICQAPAGRRRARGRQSGSRNSGSGNGLFWVWVLPPQISCVPGSVLVSVWNDSHTPCPEWCEDSAECPGKTLGLGLWRLGDHLCGPFHRPTVKVKSGCLPLPPPPTFLLRKKNQSPGQVLRALQATARLTYPDSPSPSL